MKKVISTLLTLASTATMITATAVAADFAAPNKAAAATHCTRGAGWEACGETGFVSDRVVLNFQGRYETFQIRCSSAGWAYESTGQLTKLEADTFAGSYCDGRGYNAHR